MQFGLLLREDLGTLNKVGGNIYNLGLLGMLESEHLVCT